LVLDSTVSFCSLLTLEFLSPHNIMRIIYIGIYRQDSSSSSSLSVPVSASASFSPSAIRLASVEDLSPFSFFTRGTISQHCSFGARTGIARTPRASRQTINLAAEMPFVAHCYVRADGLGGCVISDTEYPVRVAFALLTKCLATYEEEKGRETWKSIDKDENEVPDFLAKDLTLYQNPREADKLMAVQTQLDEVKDVMQTNIEQLMKRGETLDSLMAKSDDLGVASVQFYKSARKANSCCKYSF